LESVRVGLLGPIGQNGGVASHIAGLQADYAKRGIQVESVGEIGAQLLRRFHPFQFIPQYLAAMRRLRNVDLLHSHDARLVTLKKRLRKPIVTTFHGYLPEETRMWGGHRFAIDWCEAYVQAAVVLSDAIIAVDSRIAHWLWEYYHASHIHVIPNGVDSDMFHPKQEEIGLLQGSGMASVVREVGRNREESPIVLFAKGDSPKNGLEVAHAAMAIARKTLPNIKFVMALGRVRHENMPALIQAADVVIIPSVPVAGVEEATSILALEAMACGRTVIASNIGGLREIIEPNRTGILVAPRDPEALADEIVAALEDDGRRAMLGVAARRAILERYTWKKAADETIKVYEKVLA
jgi:glycosyltransferase involved in cell wall biosynthesis